MSKLIKYNVILWLIVLVIPTVAKNATTTITNLYEDTISVVIEKETEPIASRSSTERVENMHMSEQGFDLLKQLEGIDDVAIKYVGEKYYTIGYGHYGADVKKGQTITKSEADALLRLDIASSYENLVKTNFDYLELTQNEFDALVIFAYNVSPKSVKQLSGNKTRTKEELMDHILSYTASGSETNRKGLLNRRTAEKNLFEKGEY